MKLHLQHLCFVALIVGLVSLAYGLNYQYSSDAETTRFGDRVKFWHGDTLEGVVRSNGQIAIMQDPVFYDLVITSASDFWRGSGYNPLFLGPRAIFNAPELVWPEQATWIRQEAAQQDHFFVGGDSLWARVVIGPQALRIWWTGIGLPFDTANFVDYALPDLSAVVFFDCAQVNLSGRVSMDLTIGAAGRVGLEDNILYVSADSLTGRAPAGHPEKFAVVAEGEIKVLNSIANGRGNSSGLGRNQTNPSLTSLVLDGIYVALNEEFTFEQQNDPDSGYVFCTPPQYGPDDRGWIYLYGSLHQKRRGYTHRSTCQSTGYLKYYRYDPELRMSDLHLFNAPENEVTPAGLDFGEVAVGDAVMDTITFENGWVPVRLADITVPEPWVVAPLANPDSLRWLHQLVVLFPPTVPGQYIGTLAFNVPYYELEIEIPLTGRAVPAGAETPRSALPGSLALSAWPNPFNSTATLRFVLPRAGHARLRVYDTLGREVAIVADGDFSAGAHEARWDATGLGAGLYFARLDAPGQTATAKLLLVK